MLTLEIRFWKNGLMGSHVYVVRVLEGSTLYAVMPRGHGSLERGLRNTLQWLVECGKLPAGVLVHEDPFHACVEHGIPVKRVRVRKKYDVDYCHEAAAC